MLRWMAGMEGGEKGDGDDGQYREDNREENEEWDAEFCGAVGVGKVHIEDAEGVEVRING